MLIATPTCGFNTYGPAPAKRATRLIEFDIRHPYEPRTQLLEFGELVGEPSSKRAYTYAGVNQTTPGEGEGDDLLRKPSLWSQLSGFIQVTVPDRGGKRRRSIRGFGGLPLCISGRNPASRRIPRGFLPVGLIGWIDWYVSANGFDQCPR